MTTAAQDVLRAFSALTPGEQQQVAAAILRQSLPDGDLPTRALDELADELFCRYDAEEAARGDANPEHSMPRG